MRYAFLFTSLLGDGTFVTADHSVSVDAARFIGRFIARYRTSANRNFCFPSAFSYLASAAKHWSRAIGRFHGKPRNYVAQ